MSGLADASGLVADISHYQTSVDFSAMKVGGVAAVILKASQGTTFTDPTFAPRAAAARAAGLMVGAYHFFDSETDPTAQARYFLGIAGGAGVKTLAVDFEPSTAGDGEANAAALCQSIHDQTGRWPLLYTGKWSVAPSNSIFSECPLWLAEWTTAGTPNLPPGFTTWELWQFESVLNAVPGVAGPASRSRVNGTLADLTAWWGGTAPPTDKVLESFVDNTGKTHQIIDRVVSAASTAISGAAVSAFVGLALLGCVSDQREPPTKHQVAQSESPPFWREHPPTFALDANLRPVPVGRGR